MVKNINLLRVKYTSVWISELADNAGVHVVSRKHYIKIF